ncbi:MAG: hypothetical protein VB099_09870 [Candidatus Limiplasma sp.]|nr:hypothetical protein [Candidatus Limiplasma sp.]
MSRKKALFITMMRFVACFLSEQCKRHNEAGGKPQHSGGCRVYGHMGSSPGIRVPAVPSEELEPSAK